MVEDAGRPKKGRDEEDGPSPKKGRKLRAPIHLPSAREVAFGLFGFMVALVAGFYVWWNISFGNHWTDNGVYAIVVTLVGFGLAGMWITLPPRHHAS